MTTNIATGFSGSLYFSDADEIVKAVRAWLDAVVSETETDEHVTS